MTRLGLKACPTWFHPIPTNTLLNYGLLNTLSWIMEIREKILDLIKVEGRIGRRGAGTVQCVPTVYN